jgi:hypothetical protein
MRGVHLCEFADSDPIPHTDLEQGYARCNGAAIGVRAPWGHCILLPKAQKSAEIHVSIAVASALVHR